MVKNKEYKQKQRILPSGHRKCPKGKYFIDEMVCHARQAQKYDGCKECGLYDVFVAHSRYWIHYFKQKNPEDSIFPVAVAEIEFAKIEHSFPGIPISFIITKIKKRKTRKRRRRRRRK